MSYPYYRYSVLLFCVCCSSTEYSSCYQVLILCEFHGYGAPSGSGSGDFYSVPISHIAPPAVGYYRTAEILTIKAFYILYSNTVVVADSGAIFVVMLPKLYCIFIVIYTVQCRGVWVHLMQKNPATHRLFLYNSSRP
jgi:hypothetical protein